MIDFTLLDKYRVPWPPAYLQLQKLQRADQLGPKHTGAFVILDEGMELRVIASTGRGWDHVSWATIRYAKRLKRKTRIIFPNGTIHNPEFEK